MNKLSYILFSFFLMGFVTQLTAQFHSFKNYSLEQGLPQSEINAITDDHLGYLWIGTNGGGLCRFDGRTFDIFSKKQGLPDNVIYDVFQDSNTDIWIATGKGIVKYDGLNIIPVVVSDTTMFQGLAKIFQTGDGHIWLFGNTSRNQRMLFSLRDSSLVAASTLFPEIFIDNYIYNARVWQRNQIILSTGKGLFVVDNSEIRYDALNKKLDFPGRIIIPVLEDRQKRVWFKTIEPGSGYKLFTLATNGVITEKVLPQGMDVGSLLVMFEDRDGGIWMSVVYDGLVYEKDGVTTVFNRQNGLSGSIIHHIFQDREGNFWFGSQGDGLIRYSGDFFTSFTEDSGLNDDLVIGVYEDSKGDKFFCDSRGGLNKFNGSAITRYSISQKAAGMLRGFFMTDKGRRVFGSERGLCYFDEGIFSPASNDFGLSRNFPVSDIVKKGDTLYVASNYVGLTCIVNNKVSQVYNVSNSSIASNFVKSVYSDSRGRIWIGTDKGVSVLENGKITSYGEKDGLLSSNIFQFAEDRAGNIWIANFTGGLVRFDGNKFTVFNSENGLESDIVYSVISDLAGNIWAGSQLGVEHLVIGASGEVNSVYYYDRHDGFSGIENNAGAALCDKNGVLWFGTVKGVMRCIPGEKVLNQLPPSVYVDNVAINNLRISWNEAPFNQYCDSVMKWHDIPLGLDLPVEYNHISFSFDALCYSQSEKVLYRWKLSPVDQDFCPPTSNNTAVYTMLPPGDYSLQVIACNNDGVWNMEGDTFNFSVSESWWKSVTLKILLWIFIAGCIATIFILRRRLVLRHNMEVLSLNAAREAAVADYRHRINGLETTIDQLKHDGAILVDSFAAHRQQIVLLKDYYAMLADKMSEVSIMSALHGVVASSCDVGFFGVSVYDAESNSLVFTFATRPNERLSVFSFSLDDESALPVYCFNRGKATRIGGSVGVTKDLVIGDFHALSAMIVPYICSDGKSGVVVAASESPNAFTDYDFSVFDLAVSMLGDFWE